MSALIWIFAFAPILFACTSEPLPSYCTNEVQMTGELAECSSFVTFEAVRECRESVYRVCGIEVTAARDSGVP